MRAASEPADTATTTAPVHLEPLPRRWSTRAACGRHAAAQRCQRYMHTERTSDERCMPGRCGLCSSSPNRASVLRPVAMSAQSATWSGRGVMRRLVALSPDGSRAVGMTALTTVARAVPARPAWASCLHGLADQIRVTATKASSMTVVACPGGVVSSTSTTSPGDKRRSHHRPKPQPTRRRRS
jgi:hypothetical protein